MTNDALVLISGFAIRHIHHGCSPVAPPNPFLAEAFSVAVAEKSRTCPREDQAENEVPQPQDLAEFGFTNTNPCCISVSW